METPKMPVFSEKENRIISLRKKLYAVESFDEMKDIHNEITARAELLRAKYPDSIKYRIFHIFIGSTIDPEITNITEDFPGEDSIQLFLENLAKKHNLSA